MVFLHQIGGKDSLSAGGDEMRGRRRLQQLAFLAATATAATAAAAAVVVVVVTCPMARCGCVGVDVEGSGMNRVRP